MTSMTARISLIRRRTGAHRTPLQLWRLFGLPAGLRECLVHATPVPAITRDFRCRAGILANNAAILVAFRCRAATGRAKALVDVSHNQ